MLVAHVEVWTYTGELGVDGGVNESPTGLASKWIRHKEEGYGSGGSIGSL